MQVLEFRTKLLTPFEVVQFLQKTILKEFSGAEINSLLDIIDLYYISNNHNYLLLQSTLGLLTKYRISNKLILIIPPRGSYNQQNFNYHKLILIFNLSLPCFFCPHALFRMKLPPLHLAFVWKMRPLLHFLQGPTRFGLCPTNASSEPTADPVFPLLSNFSKLQLMFIIYAKRKLK